MKIGRYIKDKFFSIFIFVISLFIINMLLFAFKARVPLILSINLVTFFSLIICLLYDYYKRKDFYCFLINNVERLDKSYLVLETLKRPNFYEGDIIWDVLWNINKSMNENVKKLEYQVKDFKDYIEMWIHEVKIPLSSLSLSFHTGTNSKNDRKMQLKRIDDYLEQVLYYVRGENAERDYLINKVNLDKCINNVLVRNKDYFLNYKIDLNVDVNECVYTDSKWLEFIINQVINNSIKYRDVNKDSVINIYTEKNKECVKLIIKDNGIGIKESDIGQVFNKSFTGENGRIGAGSTGMGLFIVKSLCEKLGHGIDIFSVNGEYTSVSIIFPINKFYDVLN